MNILIISSTNVNYSSGQAVLDIYNSLKTVDSWKVKILTNKYDNYTNQDIISFSNWIEDKFFYLQEKLNNLLSKSKLYVHKLNGTERKYALQEYDKTKTKISTKNIISKISFKPDAIIVSFNIGFISYKNLYEMSELYKAPVFLRMPDMSELTGGCHYAWDCKKYMKNCGNCPAYKSNIENDQSRINYNYKKNIFQKETL